MRKISKRSAAVIATSVVAVGAVGGIALASGWLVTGTGTASAASATVQTITASASVTDKLYPGKKATAAVTVNNPNDFPVSVTDATLKSVKIVGAEKCTEQKAALSLGAVPSGVVIPGKSTAGNGTATGNWAEFVRMGSNAEAVCAGASFEVSFTLAGTSA